MSSDMTILKENGPLGIGMRRRVKWDTLEAGLNMGKIKEVLRSEKR